jgi:hypothetical protein
VTWTGGNLPAELSGAFSLVNVNLTLVNQSPYTWSLPRLPAVGGVGRTLSYGPLLLEAESDDPVTEKKFLKLVTAQLGFLNNAQYLTNLR